MKKIDTIGIDVEINADEAIEKTNELVSLMDEITPHGRLIDADALVARFSLWLEDDNYADGNTYADIAEDFIIPTINEAETIEELLPSAEAEPVKHGRWEPVTNGRGGHECSICHSYAPSYKNGEEHLSPYCPNCGAKMEERREDGDGDG